RGRRIVGDFSEEHVDRAGLGVRVAGEQVVVAVVVEVGVSHAVGEPLFGVRDAGGCVIGAPRARQRTREQVEGVGLFVAANYGQVVDAVAIEVARVARTDD